MPTYEYRCPEGHEFEVFQKMSDEPGAACPECGKQAERRISGGGGFLFKGEGFYITDYRSEEYRKKAESEKKKAEPAKEGATEGAKGGSKEGAKGSGGSKDSGGSAGGKGGASGGSATGGSGSGAGSGASTSSDAA